MLKRTKGRLLITLLVITGLAGTITDTCLTQKERKFAVNIMKDSRNQLLDQVKGLSKNQLNYKSPCTQLSIKKYLLHEAWNEKELWEHINVIMKQPANPEKRSGIKISDAELVQMVSMGDFDKDDTGFTNQATMPWKTTEEALSNFKELCTEHIKYVKTSTEDLRNHVLALGNGWVDCYQLMLVTAARNLRYTRLINEVKADRGFPKK